MKPSISQKSQRYSDKNRYMGGTKLPDFNGYYKDIVAKTMWH